MMLLINISKASQCEHMPPDEDIRRWVSSVINASDKTCELGIRIVDREEMARLNASYPHKSTQTNVLSLSAEQLEEADTDLLGEIVICAPVVSTEAQQQQKTLAAHWAHMLIHAALHLQGYDHIEEQDADIMENREIELLNQLGFPNPYSH